MIALSWPIFAAEAPELADHDDEFSFGRAIEITDPALYADVATRHNDTIHEDDAMFRLDVAWAVHERRVGSRRSVLALARTVLAGLSLTARVHRPPLGEILAITGGALLCLGSILDWSGVGYSPPWDRELAAAGGGSAVAAGIAGIRWARAAVGALPGALVGLNMGIVNYRDVSEHRHEFESYPEAAVGIGLYLVIGGAALALVGAAAALGRWRTHARLASAAEAPRPTNTEPDA